MTAATAFADVIWPGLVVGIGLPFSWAILVGLIAEYPFVKYLARLPWSAAWKPTLAMNAFSALAGLVLIPVGGLGIEIGRAVVAPDMGTFNLITWSLTFGLALAVNTTIEAVTLRYMFNVPFSFQRVAALTFANIASIGVAAWMISTDRITVG